MRCEVYNCENNNGNGYCEISNYIIITESGECDSILVKEDKEKDGGEQ